MQEPGSYTCMAVSKDSAGTWVPFTTADGRRSAQQLRTVREAELPQVDYRISGTKDRNVYFAGETIQASVLPMLFGGPSLKGEIETLTLTTPVKPFSMPNAVQAAQSLQDKEKPADITVDFWGVEDVRKYIDIDIHFQHAVEVGAWTITGENPNGEYNVKACEVQAIRSNGGSTEMPSLITLAGNSWTILSTSPTSMSATGLRIRLHASYKIKITGLSIAGNVNAGQPASTSAQIYYRWQDASGKGLTKPLSIKLFQSNTIISPPNLLPGYYGLALTTKIAGIDDQRREFGFTVVPKGNIGPGTQRDPRFALVHGDSMDPYLRTAWDKNWVAGCYDDAKQALDISCWRGGILDLKSKGVRELPLLNDSTWQTDSTKPVTQEQLAKLKAKMIQYFKATPTEVEAWELGLEENLWYRGSRDKNLYYWSNLEAKARVLKQAAKEANSSVKLVYQIAESDLTDAELFMKSGAAQQFDVLSLHTYWWPDFPSPGNWMPDYVGKIRGLITKYNTPLSIWFTEIGAPVTSDPNAFMGYPGDPGVYDKALTRSEHAAYIVKCYLTAWRLGVSNVFWYSYRDNGRNWEYAEDNFGMIDFWGFPKPTYAAYATMVNLLENRPLTKSAVIEGNVESMRFSGKDHDVIAVWTDDGKARSISAKTLKLASGNILGIRSLYNTPINTAGGDIILSGTPVYLLVN